jgi:hypothetical protein
LADILDLSLTIPHVVAGASAIRLLDKTHRRDWHLRAGSSLQAHPPLRSIASLSTPKIARGASQDVQQSIDQGGSTWEQNFYGAKGQWDQRFMHILHLEGQPCPTCGTTIENIKTGSTHTRVCPVCQPL